MLRDADIAMYRAKEKGPGHHAVYDSRLHAQAMTQLRMESDLRRALERDELTLAYQPVFQLETRSVQGFEALVRWNHPDRGQILPGEFIPLAEETGLIVPLGRWVLGRACEQLHKWHTDQPGLTMSVNISSRQFADPGFLEDVATVLRDNEIPAGRLQLEITESLIVENSEAAHSLMQGLKDLGVVLSLDDFGTGYSSLSYLHRFPIDILKVDRAFVSGEHAEVGRPAILGAIVALAHSLEMDVVAEGIETVTQAERLRVLDCEYGQGYWFARPIPAAEASLLLEGALPSSSPSSHPQPTHP
jgi:EAL domain-containing protein (putative c-di-GMP-specific phosphodiesterase class I)